MRLILSMALVALSCTVLASPKVGDKIHVVGVITAANGVSVPFKVDREITSATQDQKFTVHSATEAVGLAQPQTSDDIYEEASIIDREKAKEIIANCALAGGRAEKVTVAGQTFDSCALDSNGSCTSTTWVAEVPFGIVKQKGECASQGISSYEIPGPGEKDGELTFAWGN